MNRRRFLQTAAIALGGVGVPPPARVHAAAPHKRMGLSIASYGFRNRAKTTVGRFPLWQDALDVLDHCRDLGAGCLQIGVRGWETDFARRVRDRREEFGIQLEGQIGLPREERDLEFFERSLIAAREAGAGILRAVCLGPRRYETFKTAEAWKAFLQRSHKSLALVEPVLRRHRVKLAVENHKDWRMDEMIGLMGRFGSEWVGVNLDFGNNLALLEDPMAVIEALAPYTLTTHFKDMGVQAWEEGFLLAEVPLGEGLLDLKRAKAICERFNPGVQFNLEMITRDPLRIPVLKPGYWVTFPDLPARDLAATLALVRDGAGKKPLPRVSGKSMEEQIAFEESNVRKSFAHAREVLGL